MAGTAACAARGNVVLVGHPAMPSPPNRHMLRLRLFVALLIAAGTGAAGTDAALGQVFLPNFAQTPNQQAVAAALEAARLDPCICSTDLRQIIDAFDPLCPCEIEQGLQALSGQDIAGLFGPRLAMSRAFDERLFWQLRPAGPEPPRRLIGFTDNPFSSSGLPGSRPSSVGLPGNGFSDNGFADSGSAGNGYSDNGFPSNGFAGSSYAGDGFPGNGFPSNGFAGNSASVPAVGNGLGNASAIGSVDACAVGPVDACVACRPQRTVRRAAQAPPAATVWGQAFGGPYNSNRVNVMDADLYGILVGAGLPISEQWAIGAAAGYGVTNASGQATSADIDTFRLLGYTRWTGERAYFFGGGGYGFDSYDTTRSIVFPGVNRTAVGQADGNEIFAFAETGLTLPVNQHLLLQPLVGLTAARFTRDAFTETELDGVNGGNLIVDRGTTHSFASRIGGRLAVQEYVTPAWLVRPELRAIYRHEFIDTPSSAALRFAGAPSQPFSVLAAGPGRDTAILGTGVTFLGYNRCSVGLQYDAFLASEAIAHLVSVTALVAW